MTERQPRGFDQQYSDWYEAHLGGRRPHTVATLRELLASLPDDAEIKVSHRHDRHPVGLHDPIVSVSGVSTVADMDERKLPIYGQVASIKYVVLQ